MRRKNYFQCDETSWTRSKIYSIGSEFFVVFVWVVLILVDFLCIITILEIYNCQARDLSVDSFFFFFQDKSANSSRRVTSGLRVDEGAL